MRKFLKVAAASVAATFLAVSTPQAGAITNYYPANPNFLGKATYHFDDGKPALSVIVPEGESVADGDVRVMADNNSDGRLICTYWYGPESAIRPAYDVVLYGNPADAVEHGTEIQYAIQASDLHMEVRRFYVTHNTPGKHWAETLVPINLHDEPLAILTDCSSSPLSDEKSFNYTVVDERGDELPDLIPDAAAIRADLDSPKSKSPLGGSSLSSSSF